MAGGIIETLKERNLEKKILVTGGDADLAACWRILNDLQCMTVYKPSKLIAEKCAELTYAIASGEKMEGLIDIYNGRKNVPSLIIEPIAVDKNNLESTIVADGTYSMEEILNYIDNN